MNGRIHTLGDSREVIEFEQAEQNRQLALSMVQQGRRSLEIFSLDLEPTIFNNAEFRDAVSELARSGSRSRVRILVRDMDGLIKSGHRLLELYRRLSSRIEIRLPHPEFITTNAAFMVVDGTGYLHRELPSRYDGEANFDDPLRAMQLINSFDEMWERGETNMQLRRVHL